MKTYTKYAKCCKCGGTDIKAEHKPRHLNGIYIMKPPPEAWISERIVRTCKNCDYQWDEAPLPTEVDDFIDIMVDFAAEATGLSREELLKPWKKQVAFELYDMRRVFPGHKIHFTVMDESETAEAKDALKSMMDSADARATPDAPVIEVGDDIRCSSELANPNYAYTVVSVNEKDYELRPLYSLFSLKKNCTLIRKGPKAHRFEGLTIEKNTVTCSHIHISRKGDKDYGFSVLQEIGAFTDKNKRYTLTLTEEKEDTKS